MIFKKPKRFFLQSGYSHIYESRENCFSGKKTMTPEINASVL